MEEKTQYDLRSREAAAALNTNLAPAFRTGTAGFATSAAVAEKVADMPDAADVMTGNVGKTAASVRTAAATRARTAKAAAKAAAKSGAAATSGAAAAATVSGAAVPEVIIGNVSLQGGSVSSTDPLNTAESKRQSAAKKTQKQIGPHPLPARRLAREVG